MKLAFYVSFDVRVQRRGDQDVVEVAGIREGRAIGFKVRQAVLVDGACHCELCVDVEYPNWIAIWLVEWRS